MNVREYGWISWCLGIGLSFMLYSCHTDRRQKLLQEMTLLQSKPINYCRNKLVNDTSQEKVKYIVYSDSVDCISCAINQMDLWNPLLEYSKKYNGQLNFYFIFCPARKNTESVKLALRKNINFDYPVILDTLGEFEKLNPHLPKNKVLHTFLLDENNHVILVGDPLYNKKIKEMFYNIVEEKLGKPQ